MGDVGFALIENSRDRTAEAYGKNNCCKINILQTKLMVKKFNFHPFILHFSKLTVHRLNVEWAKHLWNSIQSDIWTVECVETVVLDNCKDPAIMTYQVGNSN